MTFIDHIPGGWTNEVRNGLAQVVGARVTGPVLLPAARSLPTAAPAQDIGAGLTATRHADGVWSVEPAQTRGPTGRELPPESLAALAWLYAPDTILVVPQGGVTDDELVEVAARLAELGNEGDRIALILGSSAWRASGEPLAPRMARRASRRVIAPAAQISLRGRFLDSYWFGVSDAVGAGMSLMPRAHAAAAAWCWPVPRIENGLRRRAAELVEFSRGTDWPGEVVPSGLLFMPRERSAELPRATDSQPLPEYAGTTPS